KRRVALVRQPIFMLAEFEGIAQVGDQSETGFYVPIQQSWPPSSRQSMSSATSACVFRANDTATHRVVNFRKGCAYIVSNFPIRIVRLEPANITDPPDVIAHAVIVHVGPIHGPPSQLLA